LLAAVAGGDRTALLRRLRSERHSLAAAIAGCRDRSGNRFGRTLLIIDQFEELVTLSGGPERQLFLDRVSEALAADPRLWVLVTLRVEFLPDLLAGNHADLFTAPIALGAMSPAEIASAIHGPAELSGMRFEDGLVQRIVADTGTPDALPLLAYLLQELHLDTDATSVATQVTYQRLGGVAGALARQADAVFSELVQQHDPEVVLATLLRLVALEKGEATGRRTPLSDFSTSQRRIISAFTEARLLTTDMVDGQPLVRVAHEALFRVWPPLRQEVTTRAEQLKRRTELERWADEWLRSGRSPDYLLTGDRLTIAGQWLDSMIAGEQVSPSARQLVEASRSHDQAFLRRVSESIGRYALTNVDRYPELAIMLATAALTECRPTPIAREALMAALAFSHTEVVLDGHTDAIRGVAWSPDGQLVATASRDGTARIWHPETATVDRVLRGHTGMVEATCWSADGTRLATASRDATVRIWRVDTGAQLTVLTVGDCARGVAWSPDGRMLAATSRDGRVSVWRTDSWQIQTVLNGHDSDVWGVHWSHDASRLATASHDRSVIVWDPIAGAPVLRLHGHLDFVEAVAFSPNDRLIATGSADQTLRIWDTASGALLYSISVCHGIIWSLAWLPDAERIAIALSDGTARIWDVVRLRETAQLCGHAHTTWSVAVSPDGQRIATGSGDATVRLWTPDPLGAERAQLTGHKGPVAAIAVSATGTSRQRPTMSPEVLVITGAADATVRRWYPDGTPAAPALGWDTPITALAADPVTTRLAVAFQDGSIRLVDTDGSDTVLTRTAACESLAWSPDGAQLAVGGKDDTIQLWDVRTRAPAGTLRGHTDWISALAWSPSGRYLASGSDDRTIRVWDLSNPMTITILTGHQNYVDCLSWAPDEQALASGSADWTVRIWNPITGTSTHVLNDYQRRVRAVAFSPNGHQLATGSDDRTVRIWDRDPTHPTNIIGVHRDSVTALAWLPDNDHVVSGSADATARVWATTVDLTALTETARKRVFRTLTTDERQEHLLPTPLDTPRDDYSSTG
jgi:WD40 repeat protein